MILTFVISTISPFIDLHTGNTGNHSWIWGELRARREVSRGSSRLFRSIDGLNIEIPCVVACPAGG